MAENELKLKDVKLAVVGGTEFDNYALMKRVLDTFREKYGISIIISGGAPGADTLAERYAHEREIDLRVFMAKWSKEGREAGPRRNLRIVETCDVMIAFPAFGSKGTYNSIDLMKKMGKPGWVRDPKGNWKSWGGV